MNAVPCAFFSPHAKGQESNGTNWNNSGKSQKVWDNTTEPHYNNWNQVSHHSLRHWHVWLWCNPCSSSCRSRWFLCFCSVGDVQYVLEIYISATAVPTASCVFSITWATSTSISRLLSCERKRNQGFIIKLYNKSHKRRICNISTMMSCTSFPWNLAM